MHPASIAIVRADDGKEVVWGQAFIPEVLYGGKWYPVCGPGFWDSDDGATTVCNAFGFYIGKIKRTEETYNVDSMPVGRCKSGEPLWKCTGGGNAFGNLNFRFSQYENITCKKGNRIGVQVICTVSHTFVAYLVIIAFVAAVIGLSVPVLSITIQRRKHEATMDRYRRDCKTDQYQNEVRRQWLRVFEAIGAPSHSLYSTIPRVARADPEVSRLIQFFQSRPGLRTIVGGQIARYYTPQSSLSFVRRSYGTRVIPYVTR